MNRDLTDLTDWMLREEVRGSREDSPPSDTLGPGHSRARTLSPSDIEPSPAAPGSLAHNS
ncbi:MAG: hypothetical protein ICV86_08460 [Microcoleus sp. T3-bin5]|nr:hypothetical protein [Microcoleus sp. T3-bin5]